MKSELVTILSTDNLELPALLYVPEKSDKVAIYLHGNGDSGAFYNPVLNNELGKALAEKGISYLALNNRGAHYKKKVRIKDGTSPEEREYVTAGVHYELIKDCVKDIDGAVAYLKSRGFKEFYLIGFSTGANKICVYDYYAKNNTISKYVHAGPGDDSGLFYNELGAKKFEASLAYARQALGNNKPLQTMPKYTGMNPFSAQSANDILGPDEPYNTFPYFEATTKRLGKKELFREYKNIAKPQMVVFGEFDEFTYTGGGTTKALALLKSVTNKKSLPSSTFEIIPAADHGFHGHEAELGKRIATWLAA